MKELAEQLFYLFVYVVTHTTNIQHFEEGFSIKLQIGMTRKPNESKSLY